MVSKFARKTQRPFATLLSLLAGTPADLEEDKARSLWLDAVAHRRELAGRLGRAIHLRVAALDLLMTRSPLDGKRRPVLVPAGLVRDTLGALAIDPLTGLLRRDHFRLVLEHELGQRSEHPPIVAYLDLDQFKRVNDHHGHAAGDHVLRALADAWRTHARRGDPMARLGGDEFAALFTGCSLEHAKRVLSRVERGFAELIDPYGTRFSAGIAVAKANDNVDALLERADRAMYAVKHRRRDRRRRAAVSSAGERPPIALCASRRSEVILDLHRAFAGWGTLLIPAPADAVEIVARLAGPRVVLVDVMAPPRGGAKILEAVQASSPEIDARLLVPAGWKARTARKLGHAALTWPSAQGGLTRFLRSTLGGPREPLPALESVDQVKALRIAVGALARGRPVAPSTSKVLLGRLEIDLLRQLLGS